MYFLSRFPVALTVALSGRRARDFSADNMDVTSGTEQVVLSTELVDCMVNAVYRLQIKRIHIYKQIKINIE